MKAWILALLVAVPLCAAAQGRSAEMNRAYDREMDRLIDKYFHEGNFEKATKLLETYAKQHPDDVDISANLAWMYFNLGNDAASMLESHRFVRDNPRNERGKIQLAQQYFTRKLYTRVPAILEPIMAGTRQINAFAMLGRAYEEIGMLKSALRVNEHRLKVYPDDATAKHNVEKLKLLIAKTSAH